jgi:catechol 2,3-dioxygenase-like lactoylglutathione lyase family enzyme
MTATIHQPGAGSSSAAQHGTDSPALPFESRQMPNPSQEAAMPRLAGVLETALYVGDLARSKAFYSALFELPTLFEDERLCALGVAGRQVLLLFRRGASNYDMRLPGGLIPAHDGQGRLHLAFAIEAGELAPWESVLAERKIPVEGRVTWPRGSTSLYFRDPDGHLVELATPGLWTVW